MDPNVLKAINDVNKRLNELTQKVENYLLGRHEENSEAINVTESALMEVAAITDEQAESIANVEEALMEVAGMVSDLSTTVSLSAE